MGRIVKLDATVVNRIAAGEIIQRPSNALKELLENSIDAHSTTIHVTAKDGGLKLLQIQDNGDGIDREDLSMVCERFTTSKLTRYEDLLKIGTFGFRGEALSSISHVAHVTIQTKTESETCAWRYYHTNTKIYFRACYSDGVLVAAKPGQSVQPKPCAGNNGTLLIVEDLFYNVDTRRKAFSNYNDEYNRILDVMQKYAVHYSHIAFTCKKSTSNIPDLSTVAKSTIPQALKMIYSSSVESELLHISETYPKYSTEIQSYLTNANYNTRKQYFLLFINNRLVDSPPLKKAIDQVYQAYLPKGQHAFIYLSLKIKSEWVDVNVHPTKREVHFLHEQEICEAVCASVQGVLQNANQSRKFMVQTTLDGMVNKENMDLSGEKKVHCSKLVRTDSTARTLDKYISTCPVTNIPTLNLKRKQPEPSQSRLCTLQLKEQESIIIDTDSNDEIEEPQPRQMTNVNLTSIITLRKRVIDNIDETLYDMIRDHTFVGKVSNEKALIQHRTKLIIINHRKYTNELFYQLGLKVFSNFGTVELRPVVDLKSYLGEYDLEDVDKIVEILSSKSEILKEYFNITITATGTLTTIPHILKNHEPDLSLLATLLHDIAINTDWTDEQQCLESILKWIAKFYSNGCDVLDVPFEAMKQHLYPSKDLNNVECTKQIADLPDLYKVFERC